MESRVGLRAVYRLLRWFECALRCYVRVSLVVRLRSRYRIEFYLSPISARVVHCGGNASYGHKSHTPSG